jgi:hypothetical protein
MCTLTWQATSTGCEVYFSRDESILRPAALAPRIIDEALMPIDPQGGGTWLAVNARGQTLALLNGYEWMVPSGADTALSAADNRPALTSRGTLIPALIKCETEQAVEFALKASVGAHFAPFRLCMIHPDGRATQWCWRGGQLDREAATVPIAVRVTCTCFIAAMGQAKAFPRCACTGRKPEL